MNFLVTNDDGYGTNGLKCLIDAAKNFGDVWVVAPAEPQSGISHQLTRSGTLKLSKVDECAFTLGGTPVDCSRIGLTQLGIDFDWVLSGVNHGANLGADTFISGTLAAAREAVILGKPAIAFSQYRSQFMEPNFDWRPARYFTEKLIGQLIEAEYEHTPLINVNFPDLCGSDSWEEVTVRECELDRNPLPLNYEKVGENEFQYVGKYADRKRTPGRDVDLCLDGSVTITSHSI